MKLSSSNRAGSGFTLVEIVVVLVVAAIVIPAIILPFVVGVQEINQPVVQGALAFLAQEEMESKIICLKYEDLLPWTNTEISGFPGYISSCSISELTDGISEITVTVNGQGETFSLVTVKTDWE